MSESPTYRCGGPIHRGQTGRVLWRRCQTCGAEILAPAHPLEDWMTLDDLQRALRWAEGYGRQKYSLAACSSPRTAGAALPPGICTRPCS